MLVGLWLGGEETAASRYQDEASRVLPVMDVWQDALLVGGYLVVWMLCSFILLGFLELL
jgi:hypothetical protein